MHHSNFYGVDGAGLREVEAARITAYYFVSLWDLFVIRVGLSRVMCSGLCTFAELGTGLSNQQATFKIKQLPWKRERFDKFARVGDSPWVSWAKSGASMSEIVRISHAVWQSSPVLASPLPSCVWPVECS